MAFVYRTTCTVKVSLLCLSLFIKVKINLSKHGYMRDKWSVPDSAVSAMKNSCLWNAQIQP